MRQRTSVASFAFEIPPTLKILKKQNQKSFIFLNRKILVKSKISESNVNGTKQKADVLRSFEPRILVNYFISIITMVNAPTPVAVP